MRDAAPLARTPPPAARAPGRARSRPAPRAGARRPARRTSCSVSHDQVAHVRLRLLRLRVARCRLRPPSGRAGSMSAPGRSRRAARAPGAAARAPVPPQPVAGCRVRHARTRSTATAARAAKISASRRSPSVKRASAPQLVVHGDHPDRPLPERPAARTGPSASPAAGRLSWSTSVSSRAESTRSLRRRSSTRPLFEPARLSRWPSSDEARLVLDVRGGLTRRSPSAVGRAIRASRASISSRSLRRPARGGRPGRSPRPASAPTSCSDSSCATTRVADS